MIGDVETPEGEEFFSARNTGVSSLRFAPVERTIEVVDREDNALAGQTD